jgi:hypothetical protein
MKKKTTGVTTVFAKDDDGLIPAPLGPESNTKLVNLLTTAEGKQDNVHEWRAEMHRYSEDVVSSDWFPKHTRLQTFQIR